MAIILSYGGIPIKEGNPGEFSHFHMPGHNFLIQKNLNIFMYGMAK